MATQKYMGSNQLVQRLTEQLRTQKNPPKDVEGAVHAILQSRGHMNKDGTLTAAGQKRNAMTAEERALDRASKRTGKAGSAFTYNPRTNSAKLRK